MQAIHSARIENEHESMNERKTMLDHTRPKPASVGTQRSFRQHCAAPGTALRNVGLMRTWMLLSVFALTLGLVDFWTCVNAQSREVPAPPQQQPIIIHSTTVHPVSDDPIENGYVVFQDGRITEVGSGDPPNINGAEYHNATDLHVYPGLISARTRLGLTEIGAVDVTHDYNEYGSVTPEVRAAVAINPDTDLIPVTRSNGILTGMVFPSGGLVPGRCSAIRYDGWTWEDMAIDTEAGLVIDWPRTEPIDAWWMDESPEQQRKEIKENLKRIETIIDDALAYYESKDNDPTQQTDMRYEAMRAALTGDKPIFVRAASMGQIESAVGWAVRRDLDITIVGGYEADEVVPLLKKHDVPVMITGLHRLPGQRHHAYDEPFTLPNKLYEAGIRFCLASGEGAAHERRLNHNAATAAAFGLPRREALKSVTLNAAELIGFGDSYGSLETGKSATLIITNGDPLEITTDVLVAYIDGRQIDLDNRHKALYRKYRKKYIRMGLLEPDAD